MSSWLSEKVAKFVKEVPRIQILSGQSTPEEVVAALEQQARSISTPQGATALLSQWCFQCGARSDAQGAGGAGASFLQLLLQSHAFEETLDSCANVPSLRADLKADKSGQETPLGQSMRALASLVLVPGALEIWPVILDALMLEEKGNDTAGQVWGPWARRALAIMKRSWHKEALSLEVYQLDQQAAELMTTAPQLGDASVGADIIRTHGGEQMSKRAIRAGLLRGQLRQRVIEAQLCRQRTEISYKVCELLVSGIADSHVPEKHINGLVADADAILSTISSSAKDFGAKQDELGNILSEVGGALQKQITQVMMTQESFVVRRSTLLEERETLECRIRDIDAELSQLDQEVGSCSQQLQQLQTRFSSATQHYQQKIGGGTSIQQHLSDQEVAAISFRDCARSAAKIVASAHQRQSEELKLQLKRRRVELEAICAAYVQCERLRLEAAADCLNDADSSSKPVAQGILDGVGSEGEIGDDLAECAATMQEAWRSAQEVLQRVEHHVDPIQNETSNNKSSASGSKLMEKTGAPSRTHQHKSESCADSDAQDAATFFAQQSALGQAICIDCNASDAAWASIPHGAYICVDCAGRHRGLGVHISFVRSITMDSWTHHQLNLMKLGGTERLRNFFQQYPKLQSRTPLRLQSAFQHRYNSRAAVYYRCLLHAECIGVPCEVAEPTPNEGHLPAGNSNPVDLECMAGGDVQNARADDDDDATDSLELAKTALEVSYLKRQQLLVDALMPPGI